MYCTGHGLVRDFISRRGKTVPLEMLQGLNETMHLDDYSFILHYLALCTGI
jgi:hypothetical protein